MLLTPVEVKALLLVCVATPKNSGAEKEQQLRELFAKDI